MGCADDKRRIARETRTIDALRALAHPNMCYFSGKLLLSMSLAPQSEARTREILGGYPRKAKKN